MKQLITVLCFSALCVTVTSQDTYQVDPSGSFEDVEESDSFSRVTAK